MVRNVAFISLVIAIIAILMIGGINRTSAILERDETQFDARSYGGQSQWTGAAHDSAGAILKQRGQTSARQQGRQSNGLSNEQSQTAKWLTLEGTAKSADENALIVATTSGSTISVQNRAWWFAQEQGFQVAVGDSLRLSGFLDRINGEFETAQIENLTSGQSINLRDESGRPLWSGRGRGDNKRYIMLKMQRGGHDDPSSITACPSQMPSFPPPEMV